MGKILSYDEAFDLVTRGFKIIETPLGSRRFIKTFSGDYTVRQDTLDKLIRQQYLKSKIGDGWCKEYTCKEELVRR